MKEYSPKRKPLNWKSLITGNEFPYNEYTSYEKIPALGPAAGKKSLPVSEYPYTLTYIDLKPAWDR